MTASAWRRACSVPCFPRPIIQSVQRRSSFAFGSVVWMRTWRSSEVTRFLSSARRWLALRLNFFPALRWRIDHVSRLSRLLLARPAAVFDFLAGREMVELHAELEPHAAQYFLDFVERLLPEIFRFQHLLLGLLDQLADIF